VLLRRSARYLLVQRGFTILLSLISIGLTLLFAVEFARGPLAGAGPSAAITLGGIFGTMLLWNGSRVHRRVSGRIDRAFFRSAQDARRHAVNPSSRENSSGFSVCATSKGVTTVYVARAEGGDEIAVHRIPINVDLDQVH